MSFFPGLITVAAIFLHAYDPALPPPIERGPSSQPKVSFACNVVWGTEYVLPIAEVLKSHGDRATFFLGGQWAEAHPDLARKLKQMGMEIASHGHAHKHVGKMGLEGNLQEIDRAEEAIVKATGHKPTLYAPAYGEISPSVLAAAKERGYRVIMWSIDTIDWEPSHHQDYIFQRISKRLHPGAIILIHPTDRTLAALPSALGEIHKRGLKSVPVGELLATSAGPSTRGGVRSASSVDRTDQLNYTKVLLQTSDRRTGACLTSAPCPTGSPSWPTQIRTASVPPTGSSSGRDLPLNTPNSTVLPTS